MFGPGVFPPCLHMRNRHPDDQTACLAVGKEDASSVATNDQYGNPKPEPGSSDHPVSRDFQSEEETENFLAPVRKTS